MAKVNVSLRIGDEAENGQIKIIDEDRLCYLVLSNSKGALGKRTISKTLLEEYVEYFHSHPDATPAEARKDLTGSSEVDRFEYGYTSTLTVMAKMIIKLEKEGTKQKALPPFPLQQIFYGAPGTGKSHTIKEEVEGRGELFFRTTFHPDSDYSTFVGAYKPVKEKGRVYGAQGPLKEGDAYIEEDRIGYRFVPQAFTRAYVAAWNTERPVFLVIEEINRGNCAQIFGDLFQLLDRKNGYSEYPIDADEALRMYLQESLKASQRSDIRDIVRRGEKLQLPPNLYLWATMNTSDQSLFPIDSAFKRRWEWKYFPIKPCPGKHYEIVVGEHQYDWWGFIKKINSVIGEATHSEDKQLGYFFVTPKDDVITAEMLVGKVFFYLWNDVFKHYGFDHSIFSKGNGETYSFADFFQETGEIEIQSVVAFLEHIDQVVDNMHPFCLDTSATGVNEA